MVTKKKKKLSGPERQQKTVNVLRQWQGIERDAIETTAQIMEKTDNLLIRQIMEIIRNDSVQHHRVQQFMIDMITRAPVKLSPDDLAEVWGQIEAHDELERQTIELAERLKAETTEPVAKLLLDYLLRDEQKHDTILGELESELMFARGHFEEAETECARILDADDMQRAIVRVAHEIIERNHGLDGVALVGIQQGGVWLAEALGVDLGSPEFWNASIDGLAADLERFESEVGAPTA